MNVYLIERPEVDQHTYDVYEAAVVIAESEDAARHTHPCSLAKWPWDGRTEFDEWVQPRDVTVSLIGVSTETEPRVVLASFKAG